MIERLNLHEISWSRSVRIWTRLSVQPAITNKIKKITTGHKLQILRLGPSVLIQGRTLRYVFLNLYLRNVWPDAKINVSPAFHKSDPKCSSSGFYIKGDVFKVAQKVTKYWASFDKKMLPRPVRKPKSGHTAEVTYTSVCGNVLFRRINAAKLLWCKFYLSAKN